MVGSEIGGFFARCLVVAGSERVQDARRGSEIGHVVLERNAGVGGVQRLADGVVGQVRERPSILDEIKGLLVGDLGTDGLRKKQRSDTEHDS